MKFLSLVVAATLVATLEARTLLFPAPRSVEWTQYAAQLAPGFRFTGIRNLHVKSAAKRYHSIIKSEKWQPVYAQMDPVGLTHAPPLRRLKVKVKSNNVKLDMNISERYSLDIPITGVEGILEADTWVGALRGLETFSQLVLNNVVHTVSIKDSPTYSHRGVLLDTSRHFFPLKDILRTLDAMAFNKMNVLHWHATDSQAWPLYFKSHPELTDKGAYSSKEVYSKKDIKKIHKYAESRGVRVVIEVDMPAHTASIAMSHPEFVVCSDEFWTDFSTEPPAGQLNPLNNDAWELVKDVIDEAAGNFPDTLFHTGGDEINTNCWESNSDITSFTTINNMTTMGLWNDWENKLLNFVIKKKKRPVVWEDALQNGGTLPSQTVVQVWTTSASNYTSLGHDVILSPSDYFYLDCGHGGWVGSDHRYISTTQTETVDDTFNYGGSGGSWCSPFKTWQRIYSYDMTMGVSENAQGKVLGGEVALWSEQTDKHVLDGRLWPRAAAAAEIYWSGSYNENNKRRTVEEVEPRFYDWVYRLQERGIDAEPVQPKWCSRHPQKCNLNPFKYT
ncbi:glycoside hydrolase superfamily [Spinellus fusiger]|nr:glycoside hydrolase superfamily [Spinellus fusiger]